MGAFEELKRFNQNKRERKTAADTANTKTTEQSDSGAFAELKARNQAKRAKQDKSTTSPVKGEVGGVGATTSAEQAVRRNERMSQLNAEIKELEAQQSQLNAGLALDAAAELYNTKISPKKTELKQLQKAAEEEQRQELLANGYRDAGFWDVTGRSFMQGMYNDQLGTESFAAMTGKDNERQEKQDILDSDVYKFVPGNLLEEAASGLFNQLGQWANAALDTRSLAMAGVAGGSALIAGQAGPQVLVPEEIISVPAAAYGGFQVGNALHMYEVEAGHAYNEMLENGISEGTARNVANVVGGVNAMLEVAQLDEVVDAYRILRRSGATQAAADTLWKKLFDMGIDVALDTAKETGQEVLQEGVTIAGTQTASKIDTGEWAYNADEIKERLGETAESSALTFGMMNVPAAGLNTYKIVRGQETKNTASGGETAAKPRMSMEDFANSESSVWNNVAYDDHETQAQLMKEAHQQMVGDGKVVQVSQETLGKVSQGFPDVRSKPRAERNSILKQAINALKTDLRSVLKGLTEQAIEFDVNGNILEARLYSTGIREVLDNIGQAQADVLYTSEDIFKNAQYLYSTPDKSGNPNIYRWNYFYTPVQIGEETVGVRIAVRDMVRGTDLKPESQIYHWGIKKDTSLDDGSRGPKVASSGVSSDASIIDTTIPHPADSVNSGAAQGFGENGTKVVAEIAQNKGTTIQQVQNRVGLAYQTGRSNLPGTLLDLTDTDQQRAYNAGQMDYLAENPDAKDLVTGQKESYTDIKTEVPSDGAKEVHLRGSGQRADGEDSAGSGRKLEESAGRDQSREEAGNRPADTEAASLTYGEAVSTASLGIGKGSERATIRVVTGGDTAYTRAAKQLAKERGLRLTLFVGDNLNINGESVRAYITGDRAFVRADHSDFTSAQLMRHETGHDMIAKGEIDPQTVRERIAERFGGEQLDRVTQMYIEAYAGSGLTAEEIWEEVICDSLGDMNIFSETVSEGTARELLTATKVASADAKVETSRGPPAATGTDAGGKMSVELNDLADNIQKGSGIRWNGGRTITLSKSEYAAVVSRISSRYHYANTQHDGVQIIDRSTDGKNAQHYVYLYTDHGFGSYQIIGRLTYGRNDALINFLREEIGNDRTAEGVSAGTDRLRNFYEHTGGGRFTHYDRTSYDGNEQTNTGGRGVRAGSDRWSDRTDSDRYDGRSDPGKVTSKASRELDMKYMSAVNRGDTETARKMVVDAAKDAGYTVRAYHGTPGGSFTVFDGEKIGSNTDSGIFGRGFYFTTDKGTADVYATERGNTMPVYLRINNPWWAVAHRNIQDVADELGMDESALTLRGYGGRGKIVTPTMSQSGQFTAHLQEHGYDAVVVQHGSSNCEIVVFDNNAVKSADPVTYDDNGNVIPLSERFNPAKADMRFSLELDQEKVERAAERYRALIEEYGSIAPGENPTREVQVPKKTADNQKVSQTVRTILEAGATPEEAIPDIEKLVADGDFSYEKHTDKQAIANAESTIRRVGWAQALSDWMGDVKSGTVSKKNTAMGWALYNNAANSGDIQTAITILDQMVAHQRSAAQALQATRILKKLSPETQLYQVQRSVENLQEELNERFGEKGGPVLKVDEELAGRFMQAKNQEERDAILKDIYRDIGRQMPSTFRDKWNAWRYLAMLCNARTHVRNIVGNAGFAPVVLAKSLTASAIEEAVYRVSGGRVERSKAFVGLGKSDRDLLSAAWEDYSQVQETAMREGKYSDFANANRYIEEGRVIFKNKVLEKTRKGNSKALDVEDQWFFRPHYAAALAQYCKANGITASQIRSGVGMDRAHAYAVKEAQKATYRDTNAFSQAISELGRAVRPGSNSVRKGIGVAVEGTLPFRKTPANILVRGLEYSPAGFLKSITWDLVQVKLGNKTAAEAIDNISAGLTGSGLLSLGIYLAAQGLVRGHGGDDEDEIEFEELMGHQAYALELPDGTSVTLDWLAPEALPFFVGVNLWEHTGGERATLADWMQAAATVTEPMLEMSCLQSLNDVFDAVGYAQSSGLDGLPAALATMVTSYLTQALPTLLGQAERSAEDTRMSTYTEKNAFLTSDMQYTIGRASARLPGWDYQQIPYIDAWGRTESTGNAAERAGNNFLNPAYTSTVETSPMEDELLRLYEQTGEAGVLPSRATKYFNADGERKDLTAQEYVKYAQAKGQTAYKVLTALTGSDAYRSMSDTEKVEAVGLVYDYANATAKTKVSGYKPEGWIAKAVKTEKATGVKAEQYVTLYLAQKGIESLKEADGDTIANSKSLLVMEMVYNVKGLTDAQRRALFEDFGVGKTVIHWNKALVQEKLKAMRKKAA